MRYCIQLTNQNSGEVSFVRSEGMGKATRYEATPQPEMFYNKDQASFISMLMRKNICKDDMHLRVEVIEVDNEVE